MLTPSTPRFHVATVEHRVTDTVKVLKYTLKKKTETGLDLNPRPSDNLIVPLCFAL